MEFQTFDSYEKLAETLCKINKDAKEMFDDMPQWAKDKLQIGDYYWRDSGHGFPIFGKIIDPGNDPEDMPIPSFERLVQAFSEACIEGELGSEFVANMIPISKEIFEKFEKSGWRPTCQRDLYVLMVPSLMISEGMMEDKAMDEAERFFMEKYGYFELW